MKKLKHFFLSHPESYLMAICLMGGYTPPFHFSFLCLAFTALLALQLYFKTKYSGLAIGGLFLLLNLFFLGALISEASEFSEISTKLLQLLGVGGLIWGVNLLFSALVLRKYALVKNA
ncbi:MAG: hypothetical protein RIC95_00360 [Vicingaceae bacterium]